MTSLTPQRCRLVSCLALTVAMLGMSAAARAQGQSGTTLGAQPPLANGFFERRITYAWTLHKSATPLTVEIAPDATQEVTYTISATRTPSPASDTAGVRGAVCVTAGARAWGVAAPGPHVPENPLAHARPREDRCAHRVPTAERG
jgi:hypothetical protein